MSHHHDHSSEFTSEKNLFLTMALNFLITLTEIIGGLVSGSLALMSDALHNFSDGIAMIISFIALRLSKRPNTARFTFGMKRAEVIAAVINASTLIIISFFLIKEAVGRFYHPAQVAGNLMLIVASGGLAANIIGTVLLKKGSRSNLNIRAAYFHLLSDVISSIAVIVGAVFIIFFQITWIDPVLTLLISVYILKETLVIVKESVEIIMMSSPEGIELDDIRKFVESINGVENIHHIHIWRLNDQDVHLEAHIEVKDMPVSETSGIQKQIEQQLHDRYAITHTTLQFECDRCETKTIIA